MTDFYALARDDVRTGFWIVDPVAGLLFSSRDPRRPLGHVRPSTGYVVTSGRPQGQVKVHRVIWESVHGPIPAGMTINHKNGIKHDNRIANLELMTAGDNIRHSIATGLRQHGGTHCKRGHRFTAANTYIDKRRGWRQCKTCDPIRREAKRVAA